MSIKKFWLRFMIAVAGIGFFAQTSSMLIDPNGNLVSKQVCQYVHEAFHTTTLCYHVLN